MIPSKSRRKKRRTRAAGRQQVETARRTRGGDPPPTASGGRVVTGSGGFSLGDIIDITIGTPPSQGGSPGQSEPRPAPINIPGSKPRPNTLPPGVTPRDLEPAFPGSPRSGGGGGVLLLGGAAAAAVALAVWAAKGKKGKR